AGFIGAHVVHSLRDAGEDVVVFDDLSNGVPERIPSDVTVVRGSLHDRDGLVSAFAEFGITGVVHLAAKKMPDESVQQPLLYYRENIGGLTTLLEAMTEAGIDALVYSSSAAAYGDQTEQVLTEDLTCHPVSPYGETKLAGEWLLADVARVTGLRYVALRYFNA